ncbi:MAG: hypothetical protein ONB23_00150 [candidate division KSB1 bacterium]|nr:hypothetical protein [candidate division KSB1 bacterium]
MSRGDAWEHRWPSPSAKVPLQWANRVSAVRDPFFWVSFVPLLAALAATSYGLLVLRIPKWVGLCLLGVAGASVLAFARRWTLHYEQIALTEEGLFRVFPQRGIPGLARLFPWVQILSARPRFLAWGRVRDCQRVSDRLLMHLESGGCVALHLRPLRLVRGREILDVGQPSGGSGRISRADALGLIEREIHKLLRGKTGRE